MSSWTSSDGTPWGIEVQVPTHSSAMVVFRHPGANSTRFNRYAWLNLGGMIANDPQQRVDPATVVKTLDAAALARLFRRSMPVSTDRPSYIVS